MSGWDDCPSRKVKEARGPGARRAGTRVRWTGRNLKSLDSDPFHFTEKVPVRQRLSRRPHRSSCHRRILYPLMGSKVGMSPVLEPADPPVPLPKTLRVHYMSRSHPWYLRMCERKRVNDGCPRSLSHLDPVTAMGLFFRSETPCRSQSVVGPTVPSKNADKTPPSPLSPGDTPHRDTTECFSRRHP